MYSANFVHHPWRFMVKMGRLAPVALKKVRRHKVVGIDEAHVLKLCYNFTFFYLEPVSAYNHFHSTTFYLSIEKYQVRFSMIFL